MGRTSKCLKLVVLATAAFVLPAASASAGTVSSDGSHITYQAGPGEDNLIYTYRGDPEGIQVVDASFDNNAVTAGSNCVQDLGDPTIATCAGTTITLDLGDRDDEFLGKDDIGEQVFGGDGNDSLIGSAGNDSLDGGPGDDILEGGRFDGSDEGRDGADVLSGGSGVDALSFVSHDNPVNVSLDGVANDTAGDNAMPDIEMAMGGLENDTLTGNDAPNELFGGPGNDVIRAGGGDDLVEGGRHNDQAFGDAGADRVFGAHGDDALDGGPGRDVLSGDGGDGACGDASCADALSDTIQARDGEVDSVACGFYIDTVTADSTDEVNTDCENVDRGSGGPTNGGGGGGGGGGSVVIPDKLNAEAALPGRLPRLRKALRRGLVLTVGCDRACGIAGRATVKGKTARRLKVFRARTRTVAKGGGSLTAAGERKIRLRFTRKARKRLKRLRRLKLTVTVAAVDEAGNAESFRARPVLRR